jgi:4-hydroxythreonine-4-phosphate dehydrogenase
MRIAITTGEPAGIGPEISVAALDAVAPDVSVTLVGDPQLLAQNGAPANVTIEPVRLAVPVAPGQLDARNAGYVLATLDRALQGCLQGEFDAVVTAPVHKGVINDAGVAFTGHTEYLAERAGARRVVMMLAGAVAWGQLRVALATTHLPLADVPAALTRDGIAAVLDIVAGDLVRRFGIAAPRIGVCALNPHAGESGYLGREEIDIIAPAIEMARERGASVEGPFPADTIFVPELAQRFDAIVAMYHDQGLAPLKLATFGGGVNVTLGLPFVRTSVDHGTALDLAGKRKADPGSMRSALGLATELARRSGRS